MTTEPLVTVNLVVYNGARYLRACLDALKRQTYRNLEVQVFDNSSTDGTADVVEREYPQFRLTRNSSNVGMWCGQEFALRTSAGAYVLALSVDVMLHPECIAECVRACDADPSAGTVQMKILQYELADLEDRRYEASTRIDTCGFDVSHARRVSNRGQGEEDRGQYDRNAPYAIFAVEGAAPFFRRRALDECTLDGHLVDPHYRVGPYGHGDDLDIGWRMQLFGWTQIFVPSAIAYHDRKTTKRTARIPVISQLFQRSARSKIPIEVRRLDWSNVRFTIIKNDYIINILKDAPRIVVRELAVFFYTLLFEPKVLLGWGRFLSLLPLMLRARRQIIQHARRSPSEMYRLFS